MVLDTANVYEEFDETAMIDVFLAKRIIAIILLGQEIRGIMLGDQWGKAHPAFTSIVQKS